jgi:hypothetical protein
MRVHVALGRAAEAAGDAGEALTWHRRALADGLGGRNRPMTAQVAEGLAGVALLEGDGERAAVLLGVGATLRGTVRAGDPDVTRVAAGSRARIGDAAFEAARERGAAITRARMPATADAPWSALAVIDEHLAALTD